MMINQFYDLEFSFAEIFVVIDKNNLRNNKNALKRKRNETEAGSGGKSTRAKRKPAIFDSPNKKQNVQR